ncbi:putative tail tape measure protein [Salmonella phage St162]|uniref:Putative tail tape measure protein n=1 Tax=Salmonella phage St162 TaxID=2024312 RepID=A0A291AXA4_9CAUD|nr:putative tail tape measure protein [Salmonella phage St162]ATE85641.1 putative tail tape measure protein [Salmonella phage St162]
MADTASLIARVKTEGVSQAEDQLDAFASAAGRADTAAGKLGDTTQKQTTKLRGFGTGAQQVGYQVQDMIVQIQGGTSAFVAIGQQGSQLAGAFGPGGAVIGAIIALSAAVGGTLYKALGGAKISAEELQASAKTLEDVLQKNKDGVYELSDGFVKLANDTGTASQALARFYEAQSATVTQTEGAKEAITDLVDSLDTWTNGSAIGAQRSLELGQQTSSLTGALSDETARLNDKYQGTNSELVKFNGELFKNIGQMQDAASKADALSGSQDKLGNAVNSTTQRLKEQNDQIIKNVQIGNLADKERYAAQAQADKEAFAKREGVTKEQIAAYNAARDEEARQDIQRVKDMEAKRAAAEQKAADTRASQQAKRAETEAQRQQNSARNFLDTLQRQNQDELAAIDAQEQQKLEKLQAFRDNETISQQQFEDAKTQIALDADAKRNEILQRQTEERIKKQFSADAYVAQMQALADSEFAELDRQYEVKLQKLNDFHSQGLIAEDTYQQTLSAINDEYALSRAKATGDAFGDMAGNIGAALGEASTAYKAFAIAQATIATYTSAIEAYKSTAAIPVVGPFLAPAAAAAAVAAGMANIGKIRSAREQGGSLAAGQISTIAERGKPEVIMPAGASRVRTAEQMRQIMGESAGKSGGENITIVNNTTGRVDSVSQERDDEGRLRIIISETVSSALQDSNSAISKSRRATRGQPGY